MYNNKKIGILIVAYNAVTTLTKVLDRIPKNVYEEIDEIAVFDDASKDETYTLSIGYKEINKVEKLKVYYNEKNRGYGGNQKYGFRYFIDKNFDAVVLLHGDGQYAPEYLKDMYDPLVKGEADVVLGSRMMKKFGGPLKGGMPLYKYFGNKILSTYQNFRLGMNLTEFHSGYRAYTIDGLRKINLDNCSDDFHFDTQIIIKAHHNNLRIKEVPIPTFYGDEICRVNGMKYAKDIYKTTNSYLKTIKGKKKDYAYSEFFAHYPLKLYSYSSHSTALKILNKKDNLDILDIGCGTGVFASQINPKNNVTGVDNLPESKVQTERFKKYFIRDLNSGLPEDILNGNKYDYVLLLDIIQDLIDDEYLLVQSKSLLKEGGNVILSVPNIANVFVRMNLLFGRFPYSGKGILDKTHLHFYTLRSIKKILRHNKFEIVKIKATPIPIIEVLPKFLKNNLCKLLNWKLNIWAILLKRFFGYQFVLTLKNK